MCKHALMTLKQKTLRTTKLDRSETMESGRAGPAPDLCDSGGEWRRLGAVGLTVPNALAL